jgi:hypothetical protein
MGGRRGGYRVLVGKPEVRRSLGRPRRRWEDNIKIDFWRLALIDVAHDRYSWWALVNAVMNLRVP